MKRFFTLLCLLVPFACFATGPIFGGNLPPVRQSTFATDLVQFQLALSYLRSGDIARVQTMEWEVLWDPNGPYNFSSIDTAIKLMAKKRVQGLWLLQPSPYPTSPWYATTWPDQWLPQRELWPAVVNMNTKVVQHILAETKKYQIQPPLFQIWNEPEGGKPGGSVTSKFGEWVPPMHELFYLLVNDLRAKGIPKNLLVAPAVSSFGEGSPYEAAELASMIPPPEFDWLSQCGYRACHIRFSASWAQGDLAKIQQGFRSNLDWVNWSTGRYKWPDGQQVIITEFYVTPGDCGVPIGTDMYPFHAIAFDLLKASTYSHVFAFGLRPIETIDPNDPWAQFGGLGLSLNRWRG